MKTEKPISLKLRDGVLAKQTRLRKSRVINGDLNLFEYLE